MNKEMKKVDDKELTLTTIGNVITARELLEKIKIGDIKNENVSLNIQRAIGHLSTIIEKGE